MTESRALPEWIGRTPDSAIPPRVRVRRFAFYGGICQLSGRRIQPGDLWDLDHIVALANGGQNRETNLWPVLRDKHREKTKADVAEKSKVYRKTAKHLGIKLRKGPKIQSRGFARAAPQRTASRPIERRQP